MLFFVIKSFNIWQFFVILKSALKLVLYIFHYFIYLFIYFALSILKLDNIGLFLQITRFVFQDAQLCNDS